MKMIDNDDLTDKDVAEFYRLVERLYVLTEKIKPGKDRGTIMHFKGSGYGYYVCLNKDPVSRDINIRREGI